MKKQFEWFSRNEQQVTVGITREAVQEIGEIVYIEFPKVGTVVEKGSEIMVLESTKAAIDLYCPVAGTVTSVNAALSTDLSLLNQDSEGAGWLYQITCI